MCLTKYYLSLRTGKYVNSAVAKYRDACLRVGGRLGVVAVDIYAALGSGNQEQVCAAFSSRPFLENIVYTGQADRRLSLASRGWLSLSLSLSLQC